MFTSSVQYIPPPPTHQTRSQYSYNYGQASGLTHGYVHVRNTRQSEMSAHWAALCIPVQQPSVFSPVRINALLPTSQAYQHVFRTVRPARTRVATLPVAERRSTSQKALEWTSVSTSSGQFSDLRRGPRKLEQTKEAESRSFLPACSEAWWQAHMCCHEA